MPATAPDPRAAPRTLGTAGHVDHGKTALVRALTGVDGDRLPEERARGLTIALGYAPLVLPSGRRASVVDVPGHEHFVRTMVAGATGVDCALVVVAADDGVMPQTREHVAVLDALGVGPRVAAVTKADRIDPARALAEARALMGGDVEVVSCSSRTGDGIPELRAALERLLARTPSRASTSARDLAEPVLHVDRAFVAAGRGTVVTGTLHAGRLAVGDRLCLEPGGRPVRVRALQVHDVPLEHVAAGQRVAANLLGVRVRDVARGDVLCADGTRSPRRVLDCALALAADARHGERVHVHHGTRETPARLSHLEDDLWQLRLDRPLLALDGEHVVVRRVAPPGTLGGGRILDADARRHGRREDLLGPLRARRDGSAADAHAAPSVSSRDGPTSHARRTSGRGRDRSRPVAGKADVPHAATGLSPAAAGLRARLAAAGAALVAEATIDDAAALRELVADGRAVRLPGGLVGDAGAVGGARERILALVDRDGSTSLAEVRDALGLSRRPTQALLEHLDADRTLRRRPQDDRRVRVRSARR